jgi:hypothetical protein
MEFHGLWAAPVKIKSYVIDSLLYRFIIKATFEVAFDFTDYRLNSA